MCTHVSIDILDVQGQIFPFAAWKQLSEKSRCQWCCELKVIVMRIVLVILACEADVDILVISCELRQYHPRCHRTFKLNLIEFGWVHESIFWDNVILNETGFTLVVRAGLSRSFPSAFIFSKREAEAASVVLFWSRQFYLKDVTEPQKFIQTSANLKNSICNVISPANNNLSEKKLATKILLNA